MINIPEIILYNHLEYFLQYIRKDLIETTDERKTFLYQILNGIELKKLGLNYYTEAKDIFLRDRTHPRCLEIRMFFDADRAAIPTIHINLPSEQAYQDGLGVDTGYQENIVDTTGETYYETHTRTFNSTYQIIVSSDNTNEVIIIYNVLKAFLIAILDLIDLAGLRNLKLGGGDLQLNPEIVPPHIFIRALTLNCFIEMTVPTTIKNKIIKDIELGSTTPHI